jgi:osmotically-inducible protein OsmY
LFISNIDLHKHLIEELAFDPSVDERNIAVAVDNGVVTLTGSVPSYAGKLAAERATKRVRGVLGMAEELTIDLPALHERTDTDLIFSAQQALRWNSNIPIDAVFVKAENGRLTLSGTLDWQYQREAARLAAASIPGVRGVTNDIALRKHVAVSDIKQKIQDSFRRNAEIDATRIVVEASGGTVTLSGVVHSWTEREDAAVAAYSIAGVTDVRNLTTLSLN